MRRKTYKTRVSGRFLPLFRIAIKAFRWYFQAFIFSHWKTKQKLQIQKNVWSLKKGSSMQIFLISTGHNHSLSSFVQNKPTNRQTNKTSHVTIHIDYKPIKAYVHFSIIKHFFIPLLCLHKNMKFQVSSIWLCISCIVQTCID